MMQSSGTQKKNPIELAKRSVKSSQGGPKLVEVWKQEKKLKLRKEFKPLSLGKPAVDLTNRKNWMEELEDDGT